ncbi:Ti-type conjugative transfer relaxase TraA (plasmid) [Rhizobium sp. WL3]|uniref:Ti-type conjugative transfer relaxase TraA n=1 Tax=Rhizobium sp. WL3 TaxID=2603277 RepID=UPI0011C1DB9B|nr:Ti-type conjugative transfer relaxase TraA [Rhizobium sp. WL3]QEE43338.1 Ti-type conjugative transfer relaxase TraA [Rhizobium sp. WL3]
MAVPHFSVNILSRGKGGSAVMSAAYRHCAKMTFEREGRLVDYTRKQGLAHEEFVIPENAPDWLRAMLADRPVSSASEAFWNKVESIEKRSDAQLARDVTIALPIELSTSQNIELVRDFVARQITARGMVADWVYHDVPGNPHIHLMTTLRPLTEDGFGQKKVVVAGPDGRALRNDSGKIVYEIWAGGREDFNAFRDGWFACQNHHLARAGIDLSVDGRSFEKQGIELAPTIHLGVGTKAIERKARIAQEKAPLDQLARQEELRLENSERLKRNPLIVLDMISREKSVFDARDVARILHRHIDDAGQFQSLMARILQSPEVLRLDRERLDFVTGTRTPAKYTTRELIRLEAEMANRANWLSRRQSHGIKQQVLERVFARHDRLSDEQKTAISHVAGNERIAAVIGRAGAGKTTMMKAAREAWEAAGYRVVGAALAGKAAEGLEKEAGISSRTLSSWEHAWAVGRDRLDAQSVFVLDEAGMVSSRQMALFVEAIVHAGAKLILVGDPEQLQPIEAGAAFRAIAERIGYAELETIYRQREQWMRDASLDLARGYTARAVEAYEAKGKLIGAELKGDAILSLIGDWDRDYDPAKSMLILAHLRRDVGLLNRLARERLIARGVIDIGFAFRTAEGRRDFAAGDQIVFLKNEGSMGVRNGMLGKVVEASAGRLVVEVGEGEHRRRVSVEERFYNNLDHGYATTVHKAQGATVDRVKVLASLSLDRHLTYVAMTRHREDLGIYYGRRSFAKAGGLVGILSRRNTKETTLDYAGGRFYGAALRFAEARGLHLINVARTMARDRLEWTVRQRAKLNALAGRLLATGTRIRRIMTARKSVSDAGVEAKPMVAAPLGEGPMVATPILGNPLVSGVTLHARSVGQAVEERLLADPVVVRQWQDVSMRFHLVYAEPEAAFRAMDVDAMLRDRGQAKRTIARIASEPEAFGLLKGKTGMLASRTHRSDRDLAVRNVAALVGSLRDYTRLRAEAEERYRNQELATRRRAACEIPLPSAQALAVLERLSRAVDRNAFASVIEQSVLDDRLKAELDGLAKTVADRFGERTFLPLAASRANGEVFQRVTAGMNATQRQELEKAWDVMRSVQQFSAHERSTNALKASEALRQRQTQGLSLK